MLDCKKALVETNGNIDEAIDWLREKGISKAAKKSSRIAAEGLSNVFVDGNKAVILEINSETDFVAKNEKFIDLVEKVGKTILSGNVEKMEDALLLPIENGTLNDYLVANVATIGENLSFRRFNVVSKNDNEVFGSYLHMGGKISVLVTLLNSNKEVANDVAMHIAAMNPKYVTKNQISSEELEKEEAILKEQAVNEGKPLEIAEKMVIGRIKKYCKEICLDEQEFIKDSDITVGKYVSNNGGEIINMIRYEVGEGIEKKEENFAEEVMNQINN